MIIFTNLNNLLNLIILFSSSTTTLNGTEIFFFLKPFLLLKSNFLCLFKYILEAEEINLSSATGNAVSNSIEENTLSEKKNFLLS